MAQEGLYLVKVMVGNSSMAGAPTLHLSLFVNPAAGTVGGNAVVTQALPPPYGATEIPEVHGNIHHTGLGKDVMLVSLRGQYMVSAPLPAIGTSLAYFTASLAVDGGWKGKGTFSYSGHTIADVAVAPEE